MQIYDLKVLHMSSPSAVDQTPYFSWKLSSDKTNVLQTAYQVAVFDQHDEVWNSGKIAGRQQSFVEYSGSKLRSRQSYRWQVKAWDNTGEDAIAESSFETAFWDESDWKASWVESTIKREAVDEFKFVSTAPAVYFERSFYLEKTVDRARLYATALGVYQLFVNGQRPDDREFAPEFTPYETLQYYQTYDVSALLKPGDNILNLNVGDGWYFSQQSAPIMKNPQERPAILYQLEVTYADGDQCMICSDGTENCSLGPICYSDIFVGEKQDLRIGLADKKRVATLNLGYKMLRSQPMPPVRPVRLMPAQAVFISPAGEIIVDFGQILAGRARIYLDLPSGQEVSFEYFEILNQHGNYLNTMFAPQKDIVISSGNPVEYEACFTFHGFRYIRVTGMDIDQVFKENFRAVLLTTEKESLAEFDCSDSRLNRLYQNVRWSQANNMMSIPTDCPSREKAGWTGDILIYARTALINEDVTPILTSWLRCVRENQAEDGSIMITSPYTKLYHNLFLEVAKRFGDNQATGVAGWSDAIVWVPYEMYLVTGNTLVLKENFVAMNKWCDYIIRTAREKRGDQGVPEKLDQYLWNTGFHFGEWLVPSRHDNTGEQFGICRESSFYIAPFFGYQTLAKMCAICSALGRENERLYYEDIAGKMKVAIQQGLFYTDKMPSHLMGAYVLAFAFDLVPEDLKETYKLRLTNLFKQNGGCLDTGFLATPFILDTLWNLGEKELAEQILWQDRRPSWLYEVDHGATAIWEAWDADEAAKTNRFVSFDHYAFGCVDDFISRRIAGMDSLTPGFSHVLIMPEPGSRLDYVKRCFRSEAGEIEVAWTNDRLKVEIPANMTATVKWQGRTIDVGSGKYSF